MTGFMGRMKGVTVASVLAALVGGSVLTLEATSTNDGDGVDVDFASMTIDRVDD